MKKIILSIFMICGVSGLAACGGSKENLDYIKCEGIIEEKDVVFWQGLDGNIIRESITTFEHIGVKTSVKIRYTDEGLPESNEITAKQNNTYVSIKTKFLGYHPNKVVSELTMSIKYKIGTSNVSATAKVSLSENGAIESVIIDGKEPSASEINMIQAQLNSAFEQRGLSQEVDIYAEYNKQENSEKSFREYVLEMLHKNNETLSCK